MNKIASSPQYQAITQTRNLLRIVEGSNEVIHSPNTYSIFSLLKKFYLTDQEKKLHLKNQSFLGRLHFYLIGESRLINQKIKFRIQLEKVLKDLILDKIAPLNPPSYVQENLSDIYSYKKDILETLKFTHKIAKGISLTITAFSLIWLSYNLINFGSDWSKFCQVESEFDEVKEQCKNFCPTENISRYFYQVNSKFFALPILILAGMVFQKLDNELLSRFIFSPFDNIKKSAYLITEKISKVKDFLLDKTSDPTFKKPMFL